jgi:hypothetical protein
MRYIARGLNSLASPGKEIECEQVLLSPAPWPAACLLVNSFKMRSSQEAVRSPHTFNVVLIIGGIYLSVM